VTAQPSVLVQAGACCFGIVIGYVTYRTLARSTDRAAISDLAAVVGAVGGAVITGLFPAGSTLFAWYSIGLLGGMAAFFVIFGRLNGKKKLAAMMAGEPDVVSAREVNRSEPGGTGRHESLQAPAGWDPPQG
jgi:hypothetical protein